ncbi:MAG TPA: hypothetical protein VMX97_10410 [Hyphomicrobiaceae bacterium]|nr:hypothetical protein [Hyphomicrobiaceae bacterium]
MKAAHDKEMRDVYAQIYQDSYNLEPQAMEVAMDRVTKNLGEFSLSKIDLAGMNVLNVGPGREALALHKMGAKRVFHFDISDLAVGAIHRAQLNSPALSNIQSSRRDFCAREDLPIDEGIDLVVEIKRKSPRR